MHASCWPECRMRVYEAILITSYACLSSVLWQSASFRTCGAHVATPSSLTVHPLALHLLLPHAAALLCPTALMTLPLVHIACVAGRNRAWRHACAAGCAQLRPRGLRRHAALGLRRPCRPLSKAAAGGLALDGVTCPGRHHCTRRRRLRGSQRFVAGIACKMSASLCSK